jgi:hypothetical protein
MAIPLLVAVVVVLGPEQVPATTVVSTSVVLGPEQVPATTVVSTSVPEIRDQTLELVAMLAQTLEVLVALVAMLELESWWQRWKS